MSPLRLITTPRERVLLGTMLALLALVLAWLLIVQPLVRRARCREGAAQCGGGRALGRGPGYDWSRLRCLRVAGPVRTSIAAQTGAHQAGFPGAGFASQGNRAAPRSFLDAAHPQALFGWVGADGAARPRRPAAQAQGPMADRTLSAEIVLQAGRR